MNSTNIYFIRHGEVNANNPGRKFYGGNPYISLDGNGIHQVVNLGISMQQRGQSLDRIYVSPTRRTLQTAKILSVLHGDIPFFHQREELLEVKTTGFEKWSLDRIEALDDYYNNPPEGVTIEDIPHVAERMSRIVEEARKRYEGRNIGIVSHGDPIAIAVWTLYHDGLPPVSGKEVRHLSPDKGTAWLTRLNSEGRVVDIEHVKGETIPYGKERGF